MKPVAGAIRVALKGAEQFTGGAAEVTNVTAGFELDTPVHFDTDTIDVTLDLERLGSITALPHIEVSLA